MPRKRLSIPASLLLLVLSLLALTTQSIAQSNSDSEKPALKTFGSTLENLKWDPSKHTAVEINPNERNNDDVVRVETRLVVCDVLVMDRQGRPVPGLTDKDFAIYEDGQPQRIASFSIGDNVAVGRTIVLVIDYSVSQLPYLNTSIAAAESLVDQLGPKDRMAVVTDDVKLLSDFTHDKEQLKAALESLKKRIASSQTGASTQFTALMATVKEMFGPEDIRRIVIFQTDGDELQFLQPPSPAVLKTADLLPRIKPFSLGDINSAAERARVTIYSILSGFRLLGLPEDEQLRVARAHLEREFKLGYELQGRPPPEINLSEKLVEKRRSDLEQMEAAVTQVAKNSGGWTGYLERPDQAAEIYARILSDVNRRYVLGYYPDQKSRDGKRHKVRIEVRNHPDYLVEGRKTYLAPETKK